MALAKLFQNGAFEPVDGGGNAPAPSPDATNAPSLTLAPGTGPLGAMAQGASQASLTGMAANAVSGTPTGLFSGNFSGPGAVNTGTNLGLSIAGSAVPGFGAVNTTAGLLGALAGLATLYGMPGQQTDGHLSGPITDGLVAQAARDAAPFNNPLNQNRDDNAPVTADPNEGGGNPGAGVGPAGPGPSGDGTAGATSGLSSGLSDGYHAGGTVRGRGNADTETIRATPGEEIVNKRDAARPGVRPLLKEINQPGEGPVERGLATLFRKKGAHV